MVCALYIPEVRFGNVTTMEPIMLQLIPQERFNKVSWGGGASHIFSFINSANFICFIFIYSSVFCLLFVMMVSTKSNFSVKIIVMQD